jgi:ParB/RepB/Spo0J family partition protein
VAYDGSEEDASVRPFIELADPKGKLSAQVTSVPIDSVIVLEGFNPRQTLGDIESLAANIDNVGKLIHYPLVRPAVERNANGKPKVKDGAPVVIPNRYELVSGERRLRAVQSLKWSDIPVSIDPSLAGDDDRATAVAIAENSEDGRINLNHIELGRKFADLAKAGWTPKRISSESLVHERTVRRCLELVTTPEDVQQSVANGQLSVISALELAALKEPELREKVREELAAADLVPTKKAIREIAKRVGKAEGGESGKRPQTAKGNTRAASLVNWRGAREKSAKLALLCHTFVNASDDDLASEDGHQLRGAIAYGLWERGELAEPVAPGEKPEDGESKRDFERRVKAWKAHTVAFAKQHKPDEGDAGEAGEAGDEQTADAEAKA